jgi:hypothetical protein
MFFFNDTYPLDQDLPHHCHTVDLHCFDADPDPDTAQNLDADPDPDPGGGGGGGSAKNVHPPWQNPRYAPGSIPSFSNNTVESEGWQTK